MAEENVRERRKRKRPQSGVEWLGRQPPVNLEAEISVLGSIMLRPDICDDIMLMIRPDDFFDESNRRLFFHLTEMHSSGLKIDPTLLRERLVSSGDLEVIGGMSFVGKVIDSVASPIHGVYYAKIVREKALFRQLIQAGSEIVETAFQDGIESKEALGQAEQKIFCILDERSSDSIQNVKDILHVAMDRIDARMRGEITKGVVDSGFSELDALTGGMHASELIILAARPSMGKTALALNIAENVSVKSKQPVLFISLEMSNIELIERMLCSIARVNGHYLRNGTISKEDQKRLVNTAPLLSSAPLYVDDSPSRTVSEIAAAARRIKRREKGLGLIVIDYLQLIEPDNPRDPRQEQVAKIARRLKGLARELQVPVLCLAQLNRQAEDAKEHRPRLSHLRESGAIEQDADVVMFVHREERYQTGEEKEKVAGQAQIFVEKQRNGPTGDIDLVWKSQFTRFEDKAPDRFAALDQYNPPSVGEF